MESAGLLFTLWCFTVNLEQDNFLQFHLLLYYGLKVRTTCYPLSTSFWPAHHACVLFVLQEAHSTGWGINFHVFLLDILLRSSWDIIGKFLSLPKLCLCMYQVSFFFPSLSGLFVWNAWRKREIFYVLVHFKNACSSWSSARLKPWTWNCIGVSQLHSRNPRTWTIITY